MSILVDVASGECGADEAGYHDQRPEITPLKDVECVTWRFQRTKLWRRLDKLPDAFHYRDHCEDSEDCCRESQDWSLLVVMCVLVIEGERTGDPIHLRSPIPKTVEESKIYEDWGYDYDCPSDCD